MTKVPENTATLGLRPHASAPVTALPAPGSLSSPHLPNVFTALQLFPPLSQLNPTLYSSLQSFTWTPTQTLTLVFAVDSRKPSLSFPG